MYVAEPGDILLYRNLPGALERLIIQGEVLEDGPQKDEYYHVAIALDASNKIEAYGKRVWIHPIDYGNFDAFRPPIGPSRISWGLCRIRQYEGQRYDWWLILDDALRYLTRGAIHLPVSFIRGTERWGKVCSSLAAKYLGASKWARPGPNSSPEDIYLLVSSYPAPEEMRS